MILGLDITGLFWKYRTGVQNYYHGLIEALGRAEEVRDGRVKVVLLDWSDTASHARELALAPNVEYRNLHPLKWLARLESDTGPRRLWTGFTRRVRGKVALWAGVDRRMVEGIDLLQVWSWGIRPLPNRNVIMVPDVIPLLMPDQHEPWIIKATKEIVAFARDRAQGVLTISDRSASDLAAMGVPRDRIRVVYPGITPDFHPVADAVAARRVLDKYGLDPSGYVLSVGMILPRKNLLGHLAAFERYVTARPESRLRFVVVGAAVRESPAILKAIESSPVRQRIVLTGYVPAGDMPVLYGSAAAFLYCSLYEGFGLPPIEAMACGAPVIASNTTALPEVCGDGALLVDPTNVEAIADALNRVVGDDAFRAALVQRGLTRARRFAWEESARRHIAAYRDFTHGATRSEGATA